MRITEVLTRQEIEEVTKASWERAEHIRSDPEHLAMLRRSERGAEAVTGDEFLERYGITGGPLSPEA